MNSVRDFLYRKWQPYTYYESDHKGPDLHILSIENATKVAMFFCNCGIFALNSFIAARNVICRFQREDTLLDQNQSKDQEYSEDRTTEKNPICTKPQESLVARKPTANGLGRMEPLPHDVIRKLLPYLRFSEIKQFKGVIKDETLRTLLYNKELFVKRCVLPQEYWGDHQQIEKNIIPIPKEMRLILNGHDGHLYIPIFKANYFMTNLGKIIPGRYRKVEETAKKKNQQHPGIKHLSSSVEAGEALPQEEDMRWMLVTRSIVENEFDSRHRHVRDLFSRSEAIVNDWISEKKEERQGFIITRVDTLAYALLWHWQASPDHEEIYPSPDNHFNINRQTRYGRCSRLDIINNHPVAVGDFDFFHGGIDIRNDYFCSPSEMGVSASRDFFKNL